MSTFMEELHRLLAAAIGSIASAANENCRREGEFSIKPPVAVTVCIGSKLAAALVSVLAAGNCPLLVITNDRVVHNRPWSPFIGPDSWRGVHSSDNTSANLEHRECFVRLFLTSSALCRCLMELKVHLYADSSPLSRASLILVAVVVGGVCCIKNKNITCNPAVT